MAGTARDAFEARWPEGDYGRQFSLDKLAQYQGAGFASPQFHADLNSGDDDQFFQQLWEMVLGCHLLDLGLDVQAPKGNAPDFLVKHERMRIWVEAICPTPKGVPVDFVKPPLGGSGLIEWPNASILLRWTHAIAEKRRKLERYQMKGVVVPGDRYVIAVNGHWLGAVMDSEGISGWPWAAEATLGIGPLQVKFNRTTAEWGEFHNSARSHVVNANDALVETDSFWSDNYVPVSAVLGTVKASWEHVPAPICVVHNPRTDVPIPQWLFGEELDVTGTIDGDELTATKTERPDGV